MTTTTYEHRCCMCGDPWPGDTAPPCCSDPVDDLLPVRRRPSPAVPGRTLVEVLNHDGEVIAAVLVARVPSPC